MPKYTRGLYDDATMTIIAPGSTATATSSLYINPTSTQLSGASTYYFTILDAPTTTVSAFTGIANTLYVAGPPTLTTGGTGYTANFNSGIVRIGGVLQIPTGATNGYILSSDANGNASWTSPVTPSFSGPGSTTASSSTLYVNPASTTGSASTFYFTYFTAPVITGTTATNAYTAYIDGAPSNTTNSFSLYVANGLTSLQGGLVSTGLTLTGATSISAITGSSAIDFSGGSGIFKTSTGAVTLGGTSSTVTIISTTSSTSSSTGALVVAGGIGIGNGASVAPTINWGTNYNTFPSKNISLYDSSGGADYRYYGFGISGSQLNYTTDSTSADHVFYCGTGVSSRTELFRIKGNGILNLLGGLTLTGSGSIDFSGGSGTFRTTTGAVTIGSGAVGITGTATFSGATNAVLASGSGSINFSGNSGTFLTSTGAVTIGSGAVGITGTATFSGATNAVLASGSGAIDFSGNSGAFKITTGPFFRVPLVISASPTLTTTSGSSYIVVTANTFTITLPGIQTTATNGLEYYIVNSGTGVVTISVANTGSESFSGNTAYRTLTLNQHDRTHIVAYTNTGSSLFTWYNF